MVPNHNTHGPHLGVSPGGKGSPPATSLPWKRLDPESREARELLESLDDAMFMAISGEAALVATARELWSVAVRSLPTELAEESREQYLRYAVEVSRRGDKDGVRDLAKVMIAMEIIELLTTG